MSKAQEVLTMTKTYQIWTPEDVEAGESSDTGFEYKDQQFDSLWDMAKEIRDAGPVEPSCFPVDSHTWYSTTDSEEDYRTGNLTNYAWHPKVLGKKEAEELWNLLKMSEWDFRAADPDNQ